MPLFKKGTKLYSIINMKCPVCHEADIFPTKTFSFDKPFTMHKKCTHCNQNFYPEPGYYYGAMFMSYILSGFFSLFISLGLLFGLKWSLGGSIFTMIIAVFILYVPFFRLGRIVFMNVDFKMKYDPRKSKK